MFQPTIIKNNNWGYCLKKISSNKKKRIRGLVSYFNHVCGPGDGLMTSIVFELDQQFQVYVCGKYILNKFRVTTRESDNLSYFGM